MYINRELEAEIKPFLARREAISIVGPRQAGKTTFIKHLQERLQQDGKRVKFMTFENRSDLMLFQNDTDNFKKIVEQYDSAIIDEFQYATDGGKKLKYLYDTTAVKFIISGSSSLELMFQTGKYMVGRLLDFMLWPFSFREFLKAADAELFTVVEASKIGVDIFAIRPEPSLSVGEEIRRRLVAALEQYAVYGGYPAVVLARTTAEKEKLLESIVEKYLLYDIKDLLRLPTADELRRLAQLLAAQIGGLVKYDDLSRSVRLPYRDLVKHLAILEKTFILSLARPFFTNRRTELTKNPKSYFVDAGMRNFFLSDFRPVNGRPDLGALMENYAHGVLKRQNYHPPVKYWRTKSKAEVDFVIERKQAVYPVEVKYASNRNVGKSFYSFIEKFNPPVGIILTKDYVGQERIKNTVLKFIPLSYL